MRAVYAGEETACSTIVRFQIDQGAQRYEQFQLPEPWVGRIDVAPILFVSSNPSIGKDDHAQGSSPDDVVWDSHHHAFGDDGHQTYIEDGVYTIDGDGRRIKPAVHYWSWARSQARELIADARPGLDYAFTEVVHCKSKREVGVSEAAPACIALHFERVMTVAAACVVVAVGAFAQRRVFGANVPEEPVTLVLGGRPRTVVALTHPSAFAGGKSLTNRYGEGSLEHLRRVVRNGAA